MPKGPGDFVRAGTLSTGDGSAVRVRATATGAGSVLASVTALVEDAQVCCVLCAVSIYLTSPCASGHMLVSWILSENWCPTDCCRGRWARVP